MREAQSAESKSDFIHKLSIALKEADETQLWLNLLFDEGLITQEQFVELESITMEVFALLTSIILATKKNNSNR